MSWTDPLDLAPDVLAGGAPGAVAYLRGAVMGAAARAGASGKSVLASLRAAHIGYRTQTFYQAYGALRAEAASAATAASIPLEVASGAPLAAEAPPNWTGQYTHAVTGVIREAAEGGGYTLRYATRYLVSPTILSPAEASSAYVDMLMTPGERGQAYLASVSDLLTTQLSGLWYRTGRQDYGTAA